MSWSRHMAWYKGAWDVNSLLRSARLLKTGQTTQYNSELDDGYYRKGITKAYTIFTTGQFTGTTNIDLAHYTGGAGAIAFDNTAKTITDTGSGLAIFLTNDVILTDDVDNPGLFTVTTGGVAGTITCTGATFVTKTPAGAVTIKKREAHSNNCVLDNNTGLMWSRYVAGKMGPASDGKMPWTGQLYDIFQYAAAANVALLGGYGDWRAANRNELISLMSEESSTTAPDAAVFPGWPTSSVWSSSTWPPDTNCARIVRFGGYGYLTYDPKTYSYFFALIRGS